MIGTVEETVALERSVQTTLTVLTHEVHCNTA